jgi:hypothetical protein
MLSTSAIKELIQVQLRANFIQLITQINHDNTSIKLNGKKASKFKISRIENI